MHEYFAQIIEGFKLQAERQGYDITFIGRNLGGRPMSYLEHCRYRGCDGAMIACVDFSDPQVPELIRTSPLTQREWQVLGRIYSGYSNDQIAGELDVAATTSKTHMNAFRKYCGIFPLPGFIRM
jgi:ATP/maltotriose-dependent transcriptional regulator MalT